MKDDKIKELEKRIEELEKKNGFVPSQPNSSPNLYYHRDSISNIPCLAPSHQWEPNFSTSPSLYICSICGAKAI